MQIKKLNILPTALAFAVFLGSFGGSAVRAEEGYRTEVTDIVDVGEVDISLNEYTHDENGLPVPMASPQKVHPGQDVDLLVTVSNLSNDVWLRIKAEISSDNVSQSIEEALLSIADKSQWQKTGGYYYLKEPLRSKDSVTFIRGLTVPSGLKNSDSGKSFTVDITAEAVQVKNFTPDLTSDEPWFGTVIEECVHNTKTDLDYGTILSVEFENGAEGLVRYGDELVNMWGELMPGDTVADSIKLANNYSKAVDMYMRIETLDDGELLSQLDITITYNGKAVYEGKLDDAIRDKVLIATLFSGDSGDMELKVNVPAEMKNEFALTSAAMKLIFTADFHEDTDQSEFSSDSTPDSSTSDSSDMESSLPDSSVTDSTTSESSHTYSSSNSSSDTSVIEDSSKTVIGKFVDNVKTGMASPVGQAAMLGTALIALAAFRVRRRADDKEENKDNSIKQKGK